MHVTLCINKNVYMNMNHYTILETYSMYLINIYFGEEFVLSSRIWE